MRGDNMFKFTYDDPRELILTLKLLKDNYKLSNKEIAEKLKVSIPTVSNWFRGSTTITQQYREKVEELIARTWQPGLICIQNINDNTAPLHFFLVGDIYNPFYTWIHINCSPDDQLFLIEMERQVQNKEAKIYIVKKYVDMDEANTLGRDEEQQYNIGIINKNAKCYFMRGAGKIEIKPALTYEPKQNFN